MSHITNTTLSPFDSAVDAIINGYEHRLKTLLDSHPKLATTHSTAEHQATLLHYVAANGVEDDKQQTPENIVTIAHLLLEAGANPNQMSNVYGGGHGSTPFVSLISSAHPANAGKMDELVRLFCQYGAVDTLENNHYLVDTAIVFRNREALQALVDCGASIDNIVHAAATGNLDLVQTLHQTPLAPYTNSFGVTHTQQDEINALALSASVFGGHLDIIKYLLEAGTSIDAQVSMDDSTALIEAIRANDNQISTYLLEQGATVHLKDNQGFTALHWASWYGYIDLIKLLISHNADLELKNTYGGTVLDTAIYGFTNSQYPPDNQLETIQCLIDAGANIQQVSPYPTGNDAIDALLGQYLD